MGLQIDQANTTGTTGIGFGDTGNGRDYMGQGFIPGQNNVSAVAFYLHSKDANANIGYRVWIDAADASYFPVNGIGGIGGSTLITNATLVTGALTQYLLATLVPVTIGNRYVMIAAPWNTSTNAWAASYNDWRSSTANPYANGRRVHLNGSYASPSAPDSGNADIQFRTYYEDTYGATAIKTALGLSKASIKMVNGLAIASVKSMKGLQ